MAIWLIDTLKQKNNGKFPLIDSNDVKGGFYQTDSITERNSIPTERRKEGMFCWVSTLKIVYQLVGGIENSNWTEFKSGSSSIDGYAHIWIGKEPPTDLSMLWLDTNSDGILEDETDIDTVNKLLTKINEMENTIALLVKRITALEEGIIITPPSDDDDNDDDNEDDILLLENGEELLLEDGTPLLLEEQDNNNNNNNNNNNTTEKVILLEDGKTILLENNSNLLLE